jgi:hypothetical protein
MTALSDRMHRYTMKQVADDLGICALRKIVGGDYFYNIPYAGDTKVWKVALIDFSICLPPNMPCKKNS